MSNLKCKLHEQKSRHSPCGESTRSNTFSTFSFRYQARVRLPRRKALLFPRLILSTGNSVAACGKGGEARGGGRRRRLRFAALLGLPPGFQAGEAEAQVEGETHCRRSSAAAESAAGVTRFLSLLPKTVPISLGNGSKQVEEGEGRGARREGATRATTRPRCSREEGRGRERSTSWGRVQPDDQFPVQTTSLEGRGS